MIGDSTVCWKGRLEWWCLKIAIGIDILYLSLGLVCHLHFPFSHRNMNKTHIAKLLDCYLFILHNTTKVGMSHIRKLRTKEVHTWTNFNSLFCFNDFIISFLLQRELFSGYPSCSRKEHKSPDRQLVALITVPKAVWQWGSLIQWLLSFNKDFPIPVVGKCKAWGVSIRWHTLCIPGPKSFCINFALILWARV